MFPDEHGRDAAGLHRCPDRIDVLLCEKQGAFGFRSAQLAEFAVAKFVRLEPFN